MEIKTKNLRLYYLCVFLFVLMTAAMLFNTINSMSLADDGQAVDAPLADGKGSHIYQVVEEKHKRDSMVYVGGYFAGFTLNLDGVMIVDFSEVETSVGKAALKSDLRIGDLITSVDGTAVRSSKEISRVLNSGDKKDLYNFEVLRGDERLNIAVPPLIERVTGNYRLGLVVKNDVGGIGTVTYTKQDGRFAALGHAICGPDGVNLSKIADGTAYECKISGLEKGARGKAGSVKGSIIASKRVGSVDKNICYGLYGNIDAPCGELYEVAKRDEIKEGKAKIFSAINGELKYYDIEIIKTVYQNTDDQKGMIIKITDPALLELTGGIIQGMSGSPIIQNNKLIGAVTHVFIKDPTRGYGIYLDWMVNN